MTKSGFDLDEIEQLLAAATPDPAPRSLRELDERGYARRAFGNAMIEAAPAMIARLRYLETENALMADNGCHLEAVISELRAENARLKGHWSALDKALADNIIETDQPHRVRWEGEWHYGPLADAYFAMTSVVRKLARAALGEP